MLSHLLDRVNINYYGGSKPTVPGCITAVLYWQNGLNMVTLQDAKLYMRIDGDEEDTLVTSLIYTAQSIVEDVLRRPLTDFETIPETVKQAVLLTVSTLYEYRQISKERESFDMELLHRIILRMVGSYRLEKW